MRSTMVTSRHHRNTKPQYFWNLTLQRSVNVLHSETAGAQSPPKETTRLPAHLYVRSSKLLDLPIVGYMEFLFVLSN